MYALYLYPHSSLGTNASPPVKVSLRSSWAAPPLLLEIIESAAAEKPSIFFPLLDALTDPLNHPHPAPTSPEAIYAYGLAGAKAELSDEPGAFDSAVKSLALHTATPKIEAFYSWYKDNGLDTRIGEREGCGSWVDWYGEIVCDLETLLRYAGHETLDSADPAWSPQSEHQPKSLSFDHVYPSPSQMVPKPRHTAILYASLSSANFRDLHTHLYKLSAGPAPRIEYVLRYIPEAGQQKSKTYLSGWGVTLDLKKMDYLALDDRRSHGKSTAEGQEVAEAEKEEIDHILALLERYPTNSTKDYTSPLTEEELQDIGFQAMHLIHDSKDPLATLRQLAQDFPKYATLISRRVLGDDAVEDGLIDEVLANQAKAPPGTNMVWLNGAIISENDMTPFALLRLLRKERALIRSLTAFSLTPSQAIDVLTHDAVASAQQSAAAGGVLDGLFDASDREEGGEVILWWNNLAKDKRYVELPPVSHIKLSPVWSRYAQWSPSLQMLLRPTYPGQFPSIKINLFNIIVVLDLSQYSSLQFIAGTIQSVVSRGYPWRFGFVPIVETEEGAKMARLFKYLIKKYGRGKTMTFLQNISSMQVPLQLLGPTVDWSTVRTEFDTLVARELEGEEEITVTSAPDFEAIITGKDMPELALESIGAYNKRLGLTASSAPMGHTFVNGKHFNMDDAFLMNMQNELAQQLAYLQQAVCFLALYSVKDEPSQILPFTMYVVADLNTESGLALVGEALKSMSAGSPGRVSFVHNPSNDNQDSLSNQSLLMSKLIRQKSLSTVSPDHLIRALGLAPVKFVHDGPQTVLSQEQALRKITGGIAYTDFDAEVHADYVRACVALISELRLSPGDSAIIVNGRRQTLMYVAFHQVIGPIGPGEFDADNFVDLLSYELRMRTGPVVTALESIHPSFTTLNRDSSTHLISALSSVIAASQVQDPSEAGLFDAPPRPRLRKYKLLDGKYTKFEFGDESTAMFQVAILLDPLSEVAQKWSSLMEWLITMPDVHLYLQVHPREYTELPLKRFYRYNVMANIGFDSDGSELHSQAVFQDLPVDPIYTLGMDVPQAWLVRPREALYDLDNIQLSALSKEDTVKGVQALFELDFLVAEGHARHTNSNSPPRGVQLQLTNGNGTSIDDTQIVATLGYLQFKATPGVFQLEIREGRGRDIFELESAGNDGWESPSVEAVGSEITVTSFEGITLYPRLQRRPGMETEDVLLEPQESIKPPSLIGNVFSRVSTLFGSKKESTDLVPAGRAQADINIFTVASGLLYERFASIMILSVMRNTNKTVKFWFIENFLSPSFLEFIPHLAEEYGFQYELVTYKWPSWLRAQKEKQRIIWAYKILFLDVLFPMDLKKVIFVDADQIVRVDLQELVDLDLQGAAYGYTPMGDDNTEMEGFRFWKTGYWKDFLKGRPYHISALYVIDLVKFRQTAAGDMLRQQYQGLSADPNSLANLDQDLPNNLQREIPIFSLPEDWLWCETWCSKDRLHRAKTIDLCQNPLTKEPKLARARAIPEWEVYDSEIARFARKLAAEGLIHSDVSAVDVNVLAGSAPAAPSAEVPGEAAPGETEEADIKRDEL
ncbi:hypothetical protein HWV62_23402 [Athelia sp. TMB]|nr:hypothetical protein HWV62_23402 [Athelia sp. TMB]